MVELALGRWSSEDALNLFNYTNSTQASEVIPAPITWRQWLCWVAGPQYEIDVFNWVYQTLDHGWSPGSSKG
jgi:hypothetical protein